MGPFAAEKYSQYSDPRSGFREVTHHCGWEDAILNTLQVGRNPRHLCFWAEHPVEIPSLFQLRARCSTKMSQFPWKDSCELSVHSIPQKESEVGPDSVFIISDVGA